MQAEKPNDSFLLFALAKEYEKRGASDEALTYYALLRANDPQYIGLYYHLGKLLESRHNLTAALDVYVAGMQIARSIGDQHAFAELAEAKLGISDDDDEI